MRVTHNSFNLPCTLLLYKQPLKCLLDNQNGDSIKVTDRIGCISGSYMY